MKVSIFVSCCILMLYCGSINGDLRFGIGNIQKTATKVKEDVQTFFNIKTDNKNTNEGSIVFKDSEEDVPVASTSKAPEVTPGTSVQRGGNVDVTTKVIENTTPTVTTTTTGKINATEKDGRENFAAGCATGFMRTSDGRCRPTF